MKKGAWKRGRILLYVSACGDNQVCPMTESKDLNCMRSNNVISGMDAHDGSQCVIHGMPTYVFNKWMVKKILVWQGVNVKILHLVLCF